MLCQEQRRGTWTQPQVCWLGAVGSLGLGTEQSRQLDVGLSLQGQPDTTSQMKHHLAMTSPKR